MEKMTKREEHLYEIEILRGVLARTDSEYLKRDCQKAIRRKEAELREYDKWHAIR